MSLMVFSFSYWLKVRMLKCLGRSKPHAMIDAQELIKQVECISTAEVLHISMSLVSLVDGI